MASRNVHSPSLDGRPTASASANAPPGPPAVRKRRNHRGGKKKQRRKSFAVLPPPGSGGDEDDEDDEDGGRAENPDSDRLNDRLSDAPDAMAASSRADFYDLHHHRHFAHHHHNRNLSSASIETENLLDHRDQNPFLRARRPSVVTTPGMNVTTRLWATGSGAGLGDDDEDEGAPLLSQSYMQGQHGNTGDSPGIAPSAGYGTASSPTNARSSGINPILRRGSSRSSLRHNFLSPFPAATERYNINYPPSVPGSPPLRPTDRLLQDHNNLSFGDQMLRDELRSPQNDDRDMRSREALSSGTGGGGGGRSDSQDDSKMRNGSLGHNNGPGLSTGGSQGEDDVCFPQGALLSGMAHNNGDDDDDDRDGNDTAGSWRPRGTNRRRRGKWWPDLSVLDEWSRFEKEGRGEGGRATKKIKEPQLVNGRLRPIHKGWHRAEEDAPYRFTYFNEEFQSTIHSQSISELVQPGGSFRELFIPDPPILSDSSSDEDEIEVGDEADLDAEAPSAVPTPAGNHSSTLSPAAGAAPQDDGAQPLRSTATSAGPPSLKSPPRVTSPPRAVTPDLHRTRTRSPVPIISMSPGPLPRAPGTMLPTGPTTVPTDVPMTSTARRSRVPKQPRYGERPVWWLDVLSPTEAEMKVLSKAFGIHPLTAEDIVMQEAREKVELFHHYYFVSYRSFDQDPSSETFLDPVNMYVVVFREGVLSFHFSMTPHPANVRRRIRQLSDYMILSSDWISYAIIDDITDVFVPLIQRIEEEVDDIDDAILQMHSAHGPDGQKQKEGGGSSNNANTSVGGTGTATETDTNMLLRVGDCRKRVMSLYRLLGNKADVIKGFAKRCNEHWEVAPRSEIGLYLGDIQDHIVTMTSNLSHYEKILARSHGNYLAQINIRMNERQEQTADVLGKLTVLGTIVLPMNIITGLWGMNVWVPGQDFDGDLRWFLLITAGLFAFCMACYLIAKRVYKIV